MSVVRLLAKMLSFIIQQSLAKQTIPEEWRKALDSRVLKGRPSDRSNPENYRTISLTSICCKIAEHIIVSQTMTHIPTSVVSLLTVSTVLEKSARAKLKFWLLRT